MNNTEANKLVKEVAGLLRTYNVDLARMWELRPYQRVTIAHAFARSLVENVEDDVHPHANLVIQAAYNLREMARVEAKLAELRA